ncbi:Major surface glycoprotein G [Trebouxia sp. C0010 RCD-2024]
MAVDFDYYQALGLSRSATDVEVKKAFRKLALVYHPDRNVSDTAKQDFLQICEAYDILSNPQRKGVLDLYGEQALKAGMAESEPGTGWSGYAFDAVSGPEQVFSTFFGTSNPYEALNGLASSFEKMTSTPALQPGAESTHTLLLSLEEMFHGCTKKVAYARQVTKPDGSSTTEQRDLNIVVRPGLPEGTQFVFNNEGDVGPKQKAGPVAYVLKAQPHARFTCTGSDLLHTAQIPLYQSLCGTALPIETLDGRTLNVPVTDIVRTGDKMVVPQEGMRKAGGTKGDLHITFDVVFPVALSEHQRTMLKAAFFLPPKLDAKQAKALRSFETAFKDESHGWITAFRKDGQAAPH